MSGAYDWPNLIVQVVIALATIGTLIWAILVSRGESQRASRERGERLEFEERAQASRISAWEHQWAELVSGEPFELLEDEDDYRPAVEQRRVYVHNGSDAPVYDVAVRYYDLSRDEVGTALNNAVWVLAILPPGAEPRSRTVSLAPNCAAIAENYVLEVEFRDAAGRYWVRDRDGILQRRADLDSMSARDLALRRRAEVERDTTYLEVQR